MVQKTLKEGCTHNGYTPEGVYTKFVGGDTIEVSENQSIFLAEKFEEKTSAEAAIEVDEAEALAAVEAEALAAATEEAKAETTKPKK